MSSATKKSREGADETLGATQGAQPVVEEAENPTPLRFVLLKRGYNRSDNAQLDATGHYVRCSGSSAVPNPGPASSATFARS